MPTNIAASDIIEMKVFSSLNDQVGVNITHWSCTSIVLTPTYELMIDALQVIIQGWYGAYQPVTVVNWGATVRRLLPSVTAAFIPSGAGTFGGIAEEPLPLQVSGLLTIRSALGGRGNRGRIFPPFLPVNFKDADGNMNGVGSAAMDTLAALYAGVPLAIADGTNTSNWRLIISDRSGGHPIAATTVIGRHVFATQRRRGQTGRPNVIPPF